MAGVFKTVTFMVLVFAAVVFAEDYDVGDDTEWTRPADLEFYSTWATGKTFRVGDELEKSYLRLLHDTTSLWATVLRRKYKVRGIHDTEWYHPKGNVSSTWRSITFGIRMVLQRGVAWVIGDGNTARFWTDRWLLQRSPAEFLTESLPPDYTELKVSEFWSIGVGWNAERIMPSLTEEGRLMLSAVVVDQATGVCDRMAWGGTNNGMFTVISAYKLITQKREPTQDMSMFYKRIWKSPVPERIRVFLWLVVHQAIMTNEERHRRHLVSSSTCSVCKGGIESITHILRDCPAMVGIWNKLVPQHKRQHFFSLSLLEWVFENLQCNGGDDASLGPILFAVAIWWAWKWRCGNIFGEGKLCRDRVRFIRDKAREITAARIRIEGDSQRPARVDTMIRWDYPESGWYKVNTDGASRGNPGRSAAGGVLRNDAGTWCDGFALHIGVCSAPLAELWGVYYGLVLAWEKRVDKLMVEIDSEIVVGFLMKGVEFSHPFSFLVLLCQGFISRDWTVRVVHVHREANRLADALANYAFSLQLGLHTFALPPVDVLSIINDDFAGRSWPRQVIV